jgi:carbon monoxide dehydrogenase subunit G
MRLLRFSFFILAIFIIIFLISFLLPSKVTVAKSVEINASQENVSRQITNFKNWESWYPAFKDENITVIKNSSGKDNLASVTLKDKNGKMIDLNLLGSAQNTIDIQLRSSSSTKVNYQFILTPKMNNQTQLTWNININLGWQPWKKIEGILFDKFSGDQYETALDNLRKAAENN